MKLLKRLRRALSDEGSLEAAARTAMKMLNQRDKNLLVASFDTTTELVMVFARGARADDVRNALAHLTDVEEKAR
jgi:hypothetical protein